MANRKKWERFLKDGDLSLKRLLGAVGFFSFVVCMGFIVGFSVIIADNTLLLLQSLLWASVTLSGLSITKEVFGKKLT